MSSFVIRKDQFIRAAGFCAGLASEKRYGEPALWLWDYSRNRCYQPEDFRLAFDWLFRLNALSVQRQYHDDEPETDSNAYLDEFNHYKKLAQDMYLFHPDQLRKAADKLEFFFSGLLYQVEDPDCEAKVKGFVYRLSFALNNMVRRRIYSDETEALGTWASFEI